MAHAPNVMADACMPDCPIYLYSILLNLTLVKNGIKLPKVNNNLIGYRKGVQ